MEPLRKFATVISSITADIWYEVFYFVRVNTKYMAGLVEAVLPYCMYMLGQNLAVDRGGVRVGGEIFVPIVCMVVVYYTKQFANRIGTGNTIPVPEKRFTDISDDGEVSIANSRLQELLLYVADLEDYMERKRWL